MGGEAVVSSALGVPEVLRLLQVLLRLFVFFFPKQVTVHDNCCFDFVIVGAGSAGCVLASRLSENPFVSVLLMEAGDDPTLEVMLPGLVTYNANSKFDWNYTSVDDGKSFQCYQKKVFPTSRGHGLGGSSSINYMMYVRGDPYDYTEWARIVNCSSWDYDHVLPYFKKSERLEDPLVLRSPNKRFHGTKGPLGVNTFPDLGDVKYLEALKQVGYKTVLDTNGDNTLGFNFPMYTVAEGLRQSTGFSFLSPIKHRKNLHVLRNTKVNKIIFNGNVAVGVQAVTENDVKLTIKANLEVILSAGAFNTPQLLMLSGIGPKEHLKSFKIETLKDLPVGYNLQDHTGVVIAHTTDFLKSTDTSTDPFKPQDRFLNGFVAINKFQKYPDAQFLLLSTKSTPSFKRGFAIYDNDINMKVLKAGAERELLVNTIYVLRPFSRGRVMLNSVNPNDPPKIYLGAYSNEKDLDNMVRYIEDYLRIEKSAYFKRINAQRVELSGERCNAFAPGSRDYWKCYARCLMTSIFHYSGTCSMGTVVDSELRVLGIRKLRVVDASVFPTIPRGNTNAPTIMVAEKAADMIKFDHYI